MLVINISSRFMFTNIAMEHNVSISEHLLTDQNNLENF